MPIPPAAHYNRIYSTVYSVTNLELEEYAQLSLSSLACVTKSISTVHREGAGLETVVTRVPRSVLICWVRVMGGQ